jgi:transcriptional regulator with PAS, ATPase and Fis domain
MTRGSKTENVFQYLAYVVAQKEETKSFIKKALLKIFPLNKIKLLKNCIELPKHFENPTYIIFQYNALNISYIEKIGPKRNINLFAYIENIYGLSEKDILELIEHKIDHALYPENISQIKFENFVDSKIFKKKNSNAFLDIESSLLVDINTELEENIYGISSKFKKIIDGIGKIALSDSNVLIMGESGTGKELIAKLIHKKSKRNKKNIVPVNCGAVPGELLESELFGYKKGAFTGAYADKPGRFELANQSTIFLDEIGDMNFSLQVKLLRVIQEHEIEPVGSVKPVKIDCRIITATNKNLEELIAKNLFREDLFYRINVIPIHILPLRERRADIILLIYHFLKKFSIAKNNKVFGISENAVKILLSYDWFGNIRELENIMEMLVVLNESGVISEDEIPDKYFKNSEINKIYKDYILSETEVEDANEYPNKNIINSQTNLSNSTSLENSKTVSTDINGITSQNKNYNEQDNFNPNKNKMDKNTINSGTIKNNAVNKYSINSHTINNYDLNKNTINLKNEVERFEFQLIKQALEISNGVKDKAAKLLGINRTTLIEKIKRHGGKQ